MRKLGIGLAAALLLSSTALQAQDTTRTALFGIIGEPNAEQQMSWTLGLAENGSETYKDFRYSGPYGEFGADEIVLTPGPVSTKIQMTAPVLRPPGESVASLAASEITITLPIEQVQALAVKAWPEDLCDLWLGNMAITATDPRAVYYNGKGFQYLGGMTRSIAASTISMEQTSSVDKNGCTPNVKVQLDHLSLQTSEKSGLTAASLNLALSGPGSIQSIIRSPGAKYEASGSIESLSVLLNRGVQGLTARGGDVMGEVLAASLSGVIASYIDRQRTQEEISYIQLWDDLWSISGAASLDTTDLVVKTQNVFPVRYSGGLEDAQLRNLLGDYAAEMVMKDGNIIASLEMDITGVSETDILIDLGKIDPKDPSQGIPVRLDRLKVNHRDRGFLDAFSVITSNPLSVFVLLVNDKVKEGFPQAAHSSIDQVLNGTSRFFATGRTHESVLNIVGPQDLSLHQTYDLLKRRPELIGRAFPARLSAVKSD